MDKIFLLDFDGTITLSDLANYVLETFLQDQTWKELDELFLEGKLSLEETIIREFSLIKTPMEVILKEIDRVVQTRDNFNSFINYCQKKDISVLVISAGIDFVIKHILTSLGVLKKVKLVSVKTQYTSTGQLQVTGPPRINSQIKDFKEDYVLDYQKDGYKVIFVGDGSSDFRASQTADLTFAVKGSSLERYCVTNKINYYPFIDFKEIENHLENDSKLF